MSCLLVDLGKSIICDLERDSSCQNGTLLIKECGKIAKFNGDEYCHLCHYIKMLYSIGVIIDQQKSMYLSIGITLFATQ